MIPDVSCFYLSGGWMNCFSFSYDILRVCVNHAVGLLLFSPGAFLHSRVTDASPVTTDFIRHINVRITTTTTNTLVALKRSRKNVHIRYKQQQACVTYQTRNTRDRSITHSLQRWVSTKYSISQLECNLIFIIKFHLNRHGLGPAREVVQGRAGGSADTRWTKIQNYLKLFVRWVRRRYTWRFLENISSKPRPWSYERILLRVYRYKNQIPGTGYHNVVVVLA